MQSTSNTQEMYQHPTSVAGHQFIFEIGCRARGIVTATGAQTVNNLVSAIAVKEVAPSTKFTRFGFYSAATAAPHIQIQQYSNFNVAGVATDRALFPYEFSVNQPVWIRIVEDATNRSFYFSTNGKDKSWILFAQEAVNTYFVSANIGLYFDGFASQTGDFEIFHMKLTLTT
jgi:hypothetical protein